MHGRRGVGGRSSAWRKGGGGRGDAVEVVLWGGGEVEEGSNDTVEEIARG